MKFYNYSVTCTKSIIESNKVNGKGNAITFPVFHRKMFLDAIAPVPGNPNKFRVVQSKRNGEIKYSISYIPEPKKAKWDANIIKLNTVPVQYVDEDGEEILPWKREGSLTEIQFKDWLKRRVGAESEFAFTALILATPPEKVAA